MNEKYKFTPKDIETLTGIPSTTLHGAGSRGQINIIENQVVLDDMFILWFNNYHPTVDTRKRIEQNEESLKSLLELARENKNGHIPKEDKFKKIKEHTYRRNSTVVERVMDKIKAIIKMLLLIGSSEEYKDQQERSLELRDSIKAKKYPLWVHRLPTMFTSDFLVEHLSSHDIGPKEAGRYVRAMKHMNLLIRLDNTTYARLDDKPFPEEVARYFIKHAKPIFRPKEIIKMVKPYSILPKDVYYRLNTMHKEGKLDKPRRGNYVNPYKLSDS